MQQQQKLYQHYHLNTSQPSANGIRDKDQNIPEALLKVCASAPLPALTYDCMQQLKHILSKSTEAILYVH